MIDDNNASLPCCHLFIMGGWMELIPAGKEERSLTFCKAQAIL